MVANLTETDKKLYQAIASALADNLKQVYDKISANQGTIANNLKGAIVDKTGITNNLVNTSANAIKSLVTSGISSTNSAIVNAQNSLSNQIKNITNGSNQEINNAKNAIQSSITTSTNNVNSTTSNLLNQAQSNINSAIGGAQNFITAYVGMVGDKINTAISNTNSGINDLAISIRKWIADKLDEIATALRNIFEPFIDFLNDVFGKSIGWWLDQTDTAGKTMNAHLDKIAIIFENLRKGKYKSFDEFTDDFNKLQVNTGLISTALHLMEIVPTFYAIFNAFSKPMLDNIEILGKENARTTQLTVNDLLRLRLLGRISDQYFKEEMGQLGYTDYKTQLMASTADQLLNVSDIRFAYLRGLIPETEVNFKLSQLGFNPSNVSTIKELFWVVPPINDLILMSVREVFTPNISAKYGLEQDYPSDLTQYAENQGLSLAWAKRYWAAHWQLPSPQMGYEMLHRRIINNDDMKELLKALDYMPYWRDKLIQLSYAPYTRVDIRRMYGMGILSRKEVFDAYQDIGYNDVRAEKLTRFTVEYEADASKDDSNNIKKLTQNVILTAYSRKELTKAETINRLKDMGYSTDDAELLVDLQDTEDTYRLNPDMTSDLMKSLARNTLKAYQDRTLDTKDATKYLEMSGYSPQEIVTALSIADLEYNSNVKEIIAESMRELYLSRTITDLEFRSKLTSLGFVSTEVDRMLETFSVLRELGSKKLTPAELKKAYLLNLLTPAEYENELYGLGYAAKYVAILMAMNVGDE